MVLPVIANTFRCTLNWSFGALNAANVFHVFDGSGTRTATEVATDVRSAMTAGAVGSERYRSMFAATAGDAGTTTIDVIELDGVGTTVGVTTGGIAGGATAGDMIPAGSAIVTLRTGIRGRSYRGRVFTPFVRETVQTSGILLAATVTSMQSGWTAFDDALSALPFPLSFCVASYTLSIQNPVTSVTAQQIMGTQRKRQSQLR